ncbi:MAG TPA: SCO family protein [Myxococcales bacterium]|nr:SCO family protein [Myxococcales bacterium]
MALLLAAAGGAAPAPPVVQKVAIDERLGSSIPLDLPFRDATGKSVRLGDYFAPGRPVVLALVYYHCPMLCSLLLQGMTRGLRDLGWAAGKDYEAVTVSVDPTETPALAAEKQGGYLQSLGAPDARAAWPFLVGPASSITALAEALGFRYGYDAATKTYAHGALLFVLSPSGRICRYLYGIEFSAKTFRLALLEAGEGKIGASLERIVLCCYHYDPASRRYGFYVYGFLRGGGALVLALLSLVMGRYWLRDLRRRPRDPGRPV